MKKLRVLLVDDEILIREGFRKLFDWEGHECEVIGEAADGAEALAMMDSLEPDLAIMDVNIPIINGLKVIRQARIRHPEMAFIIVSGYDDFDYCREALRLQISDYILKPVNYEEFGECIDRLRIELFERKAEEKRKTEEVEERPILRITVNFSVFYTSNLILSTISASQAVLWQRLHMTFHPDQTASVPSSVWM